MTGTDNTPVPVTGCTVTVCRDCCCGSTRKHPGVDHDAQIDRLRRALPAPHRIRVSDCLDTCDQSNVVVVHPTPEARQAGARPVWFGLVLGDAVTDDIAAWVRAGGPGRAPIGDTLALSVIAASAGSAR
ncbi:hypothetical protein GCM10010399_13180 [Dactylosporangium fulvum]|uniref:(2Fe-2S) ferredoxin domain-containing protein n=1 Tax=Dactylosporangium fulvum TaxID=53359 RepID=A0ABY5W7C2_9ACTN|nr:hypothetical protein [Dactylosporangium fulvum]UWP85260.1 hypothetical protein Dfulv_13915 [Dactylosporangium fulvum]